MTRSYAALPEMNMGFAGAKLAILTGGRVLALLRDDDPRISFPGCWDLPGGGREGNETPLDCALRETREELGLVISPARVRWGACYGLRTARTWFFVTHAGEDIASDVVFGNEGQRWAAMDISCFLEHQKVVPHFKARLREYLEAVQSHEKPPASWGGGR